METKLPFLSNPHKNDNMETKYKILILFALTLFGFLLFGGCIWYWLAGLVAAYILVVWFSRFLLFLLVIGALFSILFGILIS
jgi:hypothetical protein